MQQSPMAEIPLMVTPHNQDHDTIMKMSPLIRQSGENNEEIAFHRLSNAFHTGT